MTPKQIETFIRSRARALLGHGVVAPAGSVVYSVDGHFEVLEHNKANQHFVELSAAFRRLGVTELPHEVLGAHIRPGKETKLEVLFRHHGTNCVPGQSHVSYFLRPYSTSWQLELVEIHCCSALSLAREMADIAAGALTHH